ncbi:MAG: OmpA family protein [Desulfobacterales bacterium]|nr:peptidoglycan-binding protein [Desulfofustis sp.]NNK95365.1 OmpA family protein [Desulfobacterales bacterium]
MRISSRNFQESVSIWPGYVDVLSALIMIVIFVLLIFTLSQFILSNILTDQSSELQDLYSQIAEITELLGLEEEKNEEMTTQIAALSTEIDILSSEKTKLESDVDYLNEKRVEDFQEIEFQLKTIASLQQDINALRDLRQRLENEISTVANSLQREQKLTAYLRDRSKVLEARLTSEQERTVLAQKTIEQRDIRIEALSALIGEQQQALDSEKRLTADARAEVALLTQKISQLQAQLGEIAEALRLSEIDRQQQKEEISDLGRRLNIELARRVNDLERYRSEFFGQLREILGNNPFIQIEGDRFLLQAELLFPSGSADLSDNGKLELDGLADVLNEIIPAIPDGLQWILRVDGHTDKVPINSASYPSNWELSTARAVSVVRYLASRGIPEARMAAAGFSKFHPIDTAESNEAYRKNRRIEIKLTAR